MHLTISYSIVTDKWIYASILFWQIEYSGLSFSNLVAWGIAVISDMTNFVCTYICFLRTTIIEGTFFWYLICVYILWLCKAYLLNFLRLFCIGSEVVDGLMQVLWGILELEQPDTQTMNNIVISSVELIFCYAECLILHGKEMGICSVAPAVVLLKQLLFSSNEAVQTASRY